MGVEKGLGVWGRGGALVAGIRLDENIRLFFVVSTAIGTSDQCCQLAVAYIMVPLFRFADSWRCVTSSRGNAPASWAIGSRSKSQQR